MKSKEIDNIFIYSWRELNKDIIKENDFKLKQTFLKTRKTSKSSLVLSILVAFFIIVIIGQSLRFVRKTMIDPYIYDKFQNSRLIVYSNRC